MWRTINFADEFTLTCEMVEGLVHIGCSIDVQHAEPPQDTGGGGVVKGRKQTRPLVVPGEEKGRSWPGKFENKETFFYLSVEFPHQFRRYFILDNGYNKKYRIEKYEFSIICRWSSVEHIAFDIGHCYTRRRTTSKMGVSCMRWPPWRFLQTMDVILAIEFKFNFMNLLFVSQLFIIYLCSSNTEVCIVITTAACIGMEYWLIYSLF
jgi:hypothetical protein